MELQELHWLATFREDRFSGGIGAVHIEPLKKKGSNRCRTPKNAVLILIPTNDHTRDVIMLGGSTDELVEISQDVRERERRSFPAGDLQQRQEACLSEFLSLLVSGLSNAIGVNH